MTTLAASRQTDRVDGEILSIGLTAAGKVYQGGLVCLATDGYLAAGANTAGYRFAGVAYESKDNTSGADGDVAARVYRRGVFLFDIASVAVTDVGKRVWISDDQTLTLTPSRVCCGVIVKRESATKAWIDITPAVAPITFHRVTLAGSLTAATVTTGGAVLSLLNPFATRAVVLDFVIDMTTKSTGAATCDFGIGADGATSYDTLLDGIDMNAAAAIFDNIDNKGTNGGRGLAWASGTYITGTASATLAGMVATYWVDCLVPNAAIV